MKASKIVSAGASMIRSTLSACSPPGPAADCWLVFMMPPGSSVPIW